MTEFTSATGHRPVNELDVSEVASALLPALKQCQGGIKHSPKALQVDLTMGGMDGLDVALGTISALRMFVLYNVGPEGLREELAALAAELTRADG